MYCICCGKEISEDSNYCKYCGKRIAYRGNCNNDSSFSFIEKFKSSSIKKQILIICYILWLQLWLCVVLSNGNDPHFVTAVLYPGILFGVILPIVICCLWYIRALIKKRENDNLVMDVHSMNIFDSPNSESCNAETESLSIVHKSVSPEIKDVTNLTDFAREKGQMKIIKKDLGLPTEKLYYAFVKNGKITAEVENAIGMPSLSAEDISKQKDYLCIKLNRDGKYELNYLTNIQSIE
jgi:hypothetical protein